MKSFLHGRKALAISPLRQITAARVAKAAPSPASPGDKAAAAETPAAIEVVKEGGKVVRIVVTCACGERTEIDCLYSSGS
jgi:hypothetical protein